MKPPTNIKLMFYICGLVGAGLFTVLLIRQGAAQVGAVFATAKWAIVAVIAYHLAVTTFFDAVAWRLLLPKSQRLPLGAMFWMRWIGESVTSLVPSAAVGGEIARVRLAKLNGVALSAAAGSVLVDLTINLFVLAGYILLGLGLLVGATEQRHFVVPTLLATAIALGIFVGFYFVQRVGMFRFLARIVARVAKRSEWQSLIQGGENLDRMIGSIYARRLDIILSCAAATIALIGAAGEIWIGLRVLDLDATVGNAVILHSMTLGIRSAAFPVPSGLGVQEGAYILVGNLLGIPGEAAFALSLIARGRELAVGIPGIIAWQLIESRRLWRTQARHAPL
jgi:putative membrane protein